MKRGDAHAFFVNYTKYQTIDERRRILKDSERRMAAFHDAAPGRYGWSKKKSRPGNDEGVPRGHGAARQVERRLGHAPTSEHQRAEQGDD